MTFVSNTELSSSIQLTEAHSVLLAGTEDGGEVFKNDRSIEILSGFSDIGNPNFRKSEISDIGILEFRKTRKSGFSDIPIFRVFGKSEKCKES